jgi:hypothetical protein
MSSTDIVCTTLLGWLFMRKYTLAAMKAGRQAQLQHPQSAASRRSNMNTRNSAS